MAKTKILQTYQISVLVRNRTEANQVHESQDKWPDCNYFVMHYTMKKEHIDDDAFIGLRQDLPGIW